MSAIRTETHLQRVMDRDFSNRKKELSTLKLLVQGSSDAESVVLIRSAIALLYAHWEGLVKRIGLAYLEFVSNQSVPHAELIDSLLAHCAFEYAHKCATSSVTEDTVQIVDFFRRQQSQPARISYKKAIKTKGNLRADLFKRIVTLMGLDYGPYETKDVLINTHLADRRNCIVHGDYSEVTVGEYVQLHNDVVEMMTIFYDQVVQAARDKSYRVAAS